VRFQNIGKFRPALQSGGVLLVGKELDAFFFKEGRFRGKTSGGFVLGG